MWFWFALGSAVFAALTSILAKIGIEKQIIRDAAFQYYILSRCKIKVGKIYIVTHILHKDGYYKPEEIVLMPIPGSGSKEFLFCVKMYCKM